MHYEYDLIWECLYLYQTRICTHVLFYTQTLTLRVAKENKSLRAYLSILYTSPYMKIYIGEKKVRTKRLSTTLYKPRLYQFYSLRFKTRAQQELDQAKAAVRRGSVEL